MIAQSTRFSVEIYDIKNKVYNGTMMYTMGFRLYRLSWEAPANDGGSRISDYQIRFSTNRETTSWMNLNSTDTKLIAFLPENMDIIAEVRAINDIGPGEAAVVLTETVD